MSKTISNNENLCRARGHGVRSFTGGSFRQKIILILLIIFSSFSSYSIAGIQEKQDIPRMVQRSDLIIKGKVISTESQWKEHSRGRHIYTSVTVKILDKIKGNIKDDAFPFEVVGGTVDDITEVVSGTPAFEIDEDAILFLAGDPLAIQQGTNGKILIYDGRVYLDGSEVTVDSFIQTLKILEQAPGAMIPLGEKYKAPTAEATDVPIITNISSDEALTVTNKQVTITGTNFGSAQGSSKVEFFNKTRQRKIPASIVSWSNTQIICTVPANISAGSSPVTVTTSDGTSSSYDFEAAECFIYSGYKWPGTSPVVYYKINENTWDCYGESAAVQRAADTWNNVGANFTFQYDGSCSSTGPSYNDTNCITWGTTEDPWALAETTTWYNTVTMKIVECDTVFNDIETWSLSPSWLEYDIESVALHEFGHWLSLDDLYDPDDIDKVMCGERSSGYVKRELHQCDRDGICYIYGGCTQYPDLYDDGESYRSFSPKTIQGGESLSISTDIRNGGNAASGSFAVKFYASGNTTISTSDYYIGQKSMSSIPPGDWANCDWTGPFPSLSLIPGGTYYVGWIIDAGDNVSESNEDNNTAYKEGYLLTVQGVAPRADLYDDGETYRSFSPKTIQGGESLSISTDIRNGGNAASGSFAVKFYASGNTTISTSDYYIAQKTMSSIPAGDWANCDWTGVFPSSISFGTYYVGWIIDSNDDVSESDENNNTAYKQGYQLTVVPVVRTLTVTSSNPNSGVSITVSPNDNTGQGSGTTTFTRTYNNATVVTLTAPSTAGSNRLQKWQRDGVDHSTNLTTTVTMNNNYTMTAVYITCTPPQTQDGVVTTPVDTPVTITLQAADDGQPDPPGALTYIITSLPIHGELNELGVGLITDPCTSLVGYGNQVEYMPDIGYEGQDSFTFIANDNDGGISPGGGDSNVATITIDVSACTTIAIGMGTSTWDYPMRTYYHDSRTQVIYLASEIGMPGIITDLALDVTTVPGQTMNNWTIRMKHTSLGYYSTASLDANGWTTVYDENESIGSTGWRTFTFSTPFAYNSTDNLLVDFSHDNNSYKTSGTCRSSTPGGTRSAYAYSDSGYGDPLTWSGTTSPTVEGTSNVPNIQLTICERCPLGAPVLHAEPNITPGLRNTIWWDPVADANEYYAECANDANFTNIIANSDWITDTNYEFCSLQLGQIYWYHVKAWAPYSLKTWLQTSQVDFETDTLTDTRVSADGDVVLAGGGSTIFRDDFEDGNYDGWTIGSCSCTREVVDDTAAAGSTYGFTQTGPCSDHYEGVHYTFPPFTPDRLTFYVRTESTEASGYVLLVGSDTSHRIVWFYMHNNYIRVSQDTGYSTSCNLLTWYKVKLVFNWQAETFDFYVDDELVADNIPFKDQGVRSLETIYLHDLFGTQSWWDEIEFSTGSGGGNTPVGDIVSTAIDLPADANWGIVDFNTTIPVDTELTVDVLNGLDESVILADVSSGTDINGIMATSLKLRANLSTTNANETPVLHDWSVTYTDPAFACESDWSNVESSLQCGTPGDFDNNNQVNFADFAILAGQWLQSPGTPCADIAPLPEGDGMVNFLDFAVLAIHWLDGTDPAIECFPSSRSDYAQWVAVGRPDCWCCETQCHGDSNCDGVVDDKDRSPIQPLIGAIYPGISYDPCFDFDHDGDIDNADLNILISSYGHRPPGNCLQP